MRYLVESHPPDQLELIDGVKVVGDNPDDWVLILPDAGEPVVHLFVNSESRNWMDDKLREYQMRIQTFIEKEQGLKEVTV